ncbi:MAG TPA: hypothetical protein DEH07_07570 [Desulfotomaculum sp.]|nr:hypothetical protein [Desulfotomaculum sp.]
MIAVRVHHSYFFYFDLFIDTEVFDNIYNLLEILIKNKSGNTCPASSLRNILYLIYSRKAL